MKDIIEIQRLLPMIIEIHYFPLITFSLLNRMPWIIDEIPFRMIDAQSFQYSMPKSYNQIFPTQLILIFLILPSLL